MAGNLESSTEVTFEVRGEGRVISNWAFTHFSAAKYFATKVLEIEKANEGAPFGNFWGEIGIYWGGCVISAAASLEALINELYIHGGNPLHGSIPDFDVYFWGDPFDPPWWRRLFHKTKPGLVRRPALFKYKKALRLLGKPAMDGRATTTEDAKTLIGLRNYLIHFKPLWDESRRDERLENALADKFDLSPCMVDGDDFITKKCVSGSCADWAVDTVRNFVAEFAEKSELEPKKLGAFN